MKRTYIILFDSTETGPDKPDRLGRLAFEGTFEEAHSHAQQIAEGQPFEVAAVFSMDHVADVVLVALKASLEEFEEEAAEFADAHHTERF